MKTLCPSIRKILFTLSFLLIPVLRPCPSFSEFDLTSGRHVAPLETYRDIYYKGDTDKALELIDKHIKDRGELMQTRSYRYFVWLADKCYIHFNRGDVDIAIPIMEEIIREFPEPVFILQLAEMYKTRGLQEHYTDLLHRFRQPPGRWRFFHQEENLVAFARIAELNGENPKQLLSTFYTALINNFGDYAPVYIGAADMALRRNAYDLAEKHYQKALVVEPDNANALAGLAMCYHKAGDPRLKSVLAALLQKYPNNLTGNHIQIELLLDTNQIETADKLITPFLERNPNQLTMQSLKAAVLYLQDKTEEVAALQEKILQFNPHCSEIFSIPGKIASRKYRFAEAVAFLQQAITVNEQDIDARAQYALNLLRIGEDGMAKAQLERVFAEDPYHVQVYNQLHLLDSIDTFARIEVGPFVIQMPTEEQPVMSDDVAALLLEAFDHYQKKYEVQLKTPIHIQLFDNHDDFMVRSLGLPGSIGFMGICFGQLVTMDSPSARPKHEMNWRSVLWHEFVHVVTLQKTNNRMPRWLSEGISVYEEKQRSSAWGQDLDIRGAGNLLGEEQSGQMREVGYELYQSMLEEQIAKIRAGEVTLVEDGQWAPQINLGVPVLIPEAYVPDLDVRLGLYRRLSALHSKVELEGFAAELIDRFGPLPREVNTLMLVVRIKDMCKRAGISHLDGGPKGATIRFHNDKYASPVGLVEFIKDQRGLAKVKDNKIVVRRDWNSDADKIKGAFAIARDLAGKVKAVS